MNSKIMAEFKENHSLFHEFAERVENLASVFLRENHTRVHSISSRVKKAKSLEKKIEKNSGKYSCLADITDITGIRIITYFDDEVDAVADIIEKEFKIDWANSIDKRQLIDPDRFGYVSLHYVVSLSDERLQLSEYKKFKDCKAEFQIRSILQHTWAEIEHDLGYKRKHAIPRDIRRSFSRLAGLLEIADKEFRNIRENLSNYENAVTEQISAAPEQVFIDSVSLAAYISDSSILKKINQGISQLAGGVPILDNPYVDDKVQALNNLDIKTIGEIDLLLRENEKMILAFAKSWMSQEPENQYEDVMDTIGLFYFCYVFLGASQSVNAVCEYLNSNDIGNSNERKKLAERIIATYREISPDFD